MRRTLLTALGRRRASVRRSICQSGQSNDACVTSRRSALRLRTAGWLKRLPWSAVITAARESGPVTTDTMATVIGHTAGTAAAGTTNALGLTPDEATLQLRGWRVASPLLSFTSVYRVSTFCICASSAAVGQQSTLNPLRF